MSRVRVRELALPVLLILGYTQGELVGRRFSELFEREGVRKLDAAGGVYRLRHKDVTEMRTHTRDAGVAAG